MTLGPRSAGGIGRASAFACTTTSSAIAAGCWPASGSETFPVGSISRRHATLYIDHGVVFIIDHQSANGVYVNAERIEGSSEVRPEDTVRVGSYQLMVEESVEVSDRGGYQTAVVHPNRAHAKLMIIKGPLAGKEFLLFRCE